MDTSRNSSVTLAATPPVTSDGNATSPRMRRVCGIGKARVFTLVHGSRTGHGAKVVRESFSNGQARPLLDEKPLPRRVDLQEHVLALCCASHVDRTVHET